MKQSTISRVSNLASIRFHCLRYPQAFGLPNGKVDVIDGKFILDPSTRNGAKLSTWMRALRTGTWLNQDGRCMCGEPLLSDAELHHAIVTKGDIQGLGDRQFDIHHTYNVVLVHRACHERATKEECFSFLLNLYGLNVANWYYAFPLKKKVRLGNGILP